MNIEGVKHWVLSVKKYRFIGHGINGSSVLWKFPFFSVTKCLQSDVMHILFEGIVPHEITLLLCHCVSEGYFSVARFNSALKDFKFGMRW